MQYAGLIKNDIAAGEGINLTFFVQGCPIHCPGCHNPQTWDFSGGKELTADIIADIIRSIGANGIKRNLSIMGGEPLCQENIFLTQMLIGNVKEKYPNIKIYLWTGYVYEDLVAQNKPKIN